MTRKNLIRWTGEMIVVFLSVIGAFWFEDFRHNNQEKDDYINTLHQFRNHLASTVWQFRLSYDTAVSKSPDLLIAKQYLISADSLLADQDQNNDTISYRIISERLHTTPDFRESSIFYEQLKNYGDYVQNDQIFYILNSYKIVMNQEFLPYSQYNSKLLRLKEYLADKIDFQKTPLKPEYPLNKILLRNSILDLYSSNDLAIERDRRNAEGLSQVVAHIDEILVKYDIDEAVLDKKDIIIP